MDWKLDRTLNRKVKYATLVVTAFLTMGIALPSCPGQEAMQQQVDASAAANVEMKKQLQALDGQVKAMTGELNNAKTLLAQVSETVLQQREVVTGLQTIVAEHTTQLAASVARKAPATRATPARPGPATKHAPVRRK